MEKIQERKANVFNKLLRHDQSGLVIALIALCVVFTIATPVFFTVLNITNVLRQVSLNAIAAIGMTMIIISGEIDLSVGSIQALAGVTAVIVLNATGNIFVALIVALLIGAGTGAANGFLVTKLGINSMIATLGTMAIYRGIIMVATNAVSQPVLVPGFSEIGAGSIFNIPIPIIIAAILIGVFYFVLNNTVFGRYVYAVGGNKDSAKLAGLNVTSIKMKVYIIGNILFALSAFILTSRLDSGQPIAGIGMEMNVIAAVILGGVSLNGGTGSLAGAIIGVVILGVIQNGLVLLDVNTFYHDIVRGAVIILAVCLDVRRKKSEEARLLKESQAAA
ncbi:MAG: ABC transporter permease [Oscillospiraceae bacterium]